MPRWIFTRKTPARSEIRKVAAARREEPPSRHERVMEFVDQCLVRQGWVTLAEIESWEVRQYQRATNAGQIRKWLSAIGLVAAVPENRGRWVKEAEDEAWLAAGTEAAGREQLALLRADNLLFAAGFLRKRGYVFW